MNARAPRLALALALAAVVCLAAPAEATVAPRRPGPNPAKHAAYVHMQRHAQACALFRALGFRPRKCEQL